MDGSLRFFRHDLRSVNEVKTFAIENVLLVPTTKDSHIGKVYRKQMIRLLLLHQ